ncbi:sulfatase-like hydrolase/transferase [Proteiniclasticum sp. SCR006]|uniref:Sulfatase-like hydrolase/transferase n=1 Tax=Proteiniclasticum aestuarii TaxID=2817862 RepID=A0A939H9G9_9CLOT|nr:alkaline phosphatase family protein [Proteiniclasticum aestuarii]MBO1265611.1 sulfatase-like hydrolase/transferase [Proteiniclasticum aestuarii]
MSETRMIRRKRQRYRSYLEGWNLLLFLFGTILFMELILRVNTEEIFFNAGLLYSLLFSGTASILIYLIAGLFKGSARTAVISAALILLTLLFSSQLIYYKIFKTFYTVYSAGNGAQVLEFINDIFFAMGKNALWLVLLFLPLIVFAVLTKKSDASNYVSSWKERGMLALTLVIFFGGALAGIHLGDKEVNSAYDMYYRNNYPVASVNQLGLMTSMRIDLQRTVFGFEPELAPPPLAEVPEEPEEPEETPSETPGEEETPVEETPVVYEENVMDIDYEAIIGETSNENLKNMHIYYSTRKPTMQNEYTGRFKDYNLILITAEGYSHYAVDEEVTPTLYKMQEEGFKFTNFYNPIWGVSTSDGEYVATTGLIPKSGVWSMYKSGAISMPFTMGNQLRNLGYKTMAYHNHTYDYYNRDISHPNLGYDYKGLGNGLDVRATWPESDLEMMELTTEEYMNDVPFHTYYMTVSGHMRYSFSGNFIASKNKDLVQDLPYTEAGKAYMATQIELDRAMEHLLEKLEEAGVADKTLIAISADHYPYGLEMNEISDLAGHEVESNFELYKSSFILYAKGMEPETIDRPVSSLDIIPTISNLMGLEYDSRLMMGIDMFSDSDPLVIFNNRSFITDKGRYNSVTKEFTLNEGVTMTDEEKEEYRKFISSEIERQFYYSAMILDTDYYSIVVDR